MPYPSRLPVHLPLRLQNQHIILSAFYFCLALKSVVIVCRVVAEEPTHDKVAILIFRPPSWVACFGSMAGSRGEMF
jgi:hypothetical protein